MTVGKNAKSQGRKKKGNRKIVDPWTKKEWYSIRAPNVFEKRDVGFTMCTKTVGKRLARDNLMGRIFEANLGDMKTTGEEDSFRKFSLVAQDVQGTQVLTGINGMDMTTDKLRSLVKKWHSLIEASVDVKTTDGYVVRMFCIGFTKRRPNQNRKTSYAQTAQKKKLRRRMVEIMESVAAKCEWNELVKRLIPETIGRDIEKASQGVYPLQNVYVRKVKVIRSPKVDMHKLMASHDMGKKM